MSSVNSLSVRMFHANVYLIQAFFEDFCFCYCSYEMLQELFNTGWVFLCHSESEWRALSLLVFGGTAAGTVVDKTLTPRLP